MNQQDDKNQDEKNNPVEPTSKEAAQVPSREAPADENNNNTLPEKEETNPESPESKIGVTKDQPLELPDWMMPDTDQTTSVENNDKEKTAETVATPQITEASELQIEDDKADEKDAQEGAGTSTQEAPTTIPAEDTSIAEKAPTPPDPQEDKKHKIKSRKMSYPFNKMIANFAGCGRCSYFIAGYRVLQGELVLEKAANNVKSNQLQLPWVEEVRKLLVHSYGIQFDIDFLRLNGRCPECGRSFIFIDNSNAKKSSQTFSIQFNFKGRH